MNKILRTALLAVLMACSGTALAEMVNINKADAAALMENLPGIGEVKAKAIIKYRKEKGNFKSIDGLLEVPGIGEKTFQSLKSEVSVSKGATQATGKKPITSAKQTGAAESSKRTTKTEKDSKSSSKDSKSSSKDSKSSSKDSKSSSKDSNSSSKDSNSSSKDSKSSSSKSADSKTKVDKPKSKSQSKPKKTDAKKPKPTVTPKPKTKKSSTKKSSTKKKKKSAKQ